MRNLALHAEIRTRIPRGSIAQITLDVDEGGTYVVTENLRDADVEFEVWSIESDSRVSHILGRRLED
jgi:hypothetical protein